MNSKVYKIWLLLLDNPNKWLYTEDIAFKMDLTRKQLYAMLNKFPSPPVEKDRIDKSYGLRVRVCGTDEYLKKLREAVMLDMYKVSEEMIETIRHTLPTAAWITLTDLNAETGFTITQLSKALQSMDDAECRQVHGVPMYRRIERN